MYQRQKRSRPTREGAEEIAARALLFLADEPARLARFLSDTGLDPGTLRARIGDADTLAAAIGHVTANESDLLAFAANAGLTPEDVVHAEALLGGGAPWEST